MKKRPKSKSEESEDLEEDNEAEKEPDKKEERLEQKQPEQKKQGQKEVKVPVPKKVEEFFESRQNTWAIQKSNETLKEEVIPTSPYAKFDASKVYAFGKKTPIKDTHLCYGGLMEIVKRLQSPRKRSPAKKKKGQVVG